MALSEQSAMSGFSSRVYVDKGIFEYCAATHQDVLRYCKSIEPALPDSVALRIYNPDDPNHVDDIMNNGSILIGSQFVQQKIEAPPMFALTHEKKEVQSEQTVNLRDLLPDQNKDRTLNILKSQGIDYEAMPFAVPAPQPQKQKTKQAFNTLIDALNK